MLRELKTRHNHPRFLYGQITTSGGNTVTKDIGGDDLAAATEAAAGTPSLTLKLPSRRVPVVVATIGADVAAGGYADLSAVSTGSIAKPAFKSEAGVADDGTGDYLIFGYDSSDTDRVVSQIVKATKRRTRMFGGKLTGSGSGITVNFGTSDISASRTSTGVYSLTFKRAFSRTPIVLACGIKSSAVRAPKVTAKTAKDCIVSIFDETGTVQDDAFYIVVIGSDIRDEHGLAYAPVENSQRKPRIVVGQVTVSAGTPTFSINSNEFSSVTDNGAGDFTLNLSDVFRQECIVIATARAGRAQVHTGSASAPRLICLSAGGVATDPTTVDFILLGTDDPSEY